MKLLVRVERPALGVATSAGMDALLGDLTVCTKSHNRTNDLGASLMCVSPEEII